MEPTVKQPLLIVTGASCAGKSATCEVLFRHERDYLVLEGDLLWHDVYNTPEDGYRAYRQTWLRVCANVAQIGKPVVLCGCAMPDQFEALPERALFSDIYYIAVVCDEETLAARAREGRGVTDENWLKSSLAFNAWLRANGPSAEPPIALLDSTGLTPERAAARLHEWIMEKI